MVQKSESIKELAVALSRAQGEMESAEKSLENPYFKSKYAGLAAIWDACRGPLSKNGLSVSQVPTLIANPDQFVLETILIHSSGEWISSLYPINPAKPNDPQALGSCITYARRYALAAMVGITSEDDDGEAAVGRSGAQSRNESRPEAAATEQPESQETEGTVTFIPRKVNSMNGCYKQDTKTHKKGEKWTKYGILHPDGRWFGTFDKKQGGLAVSACEGGSEVTLEWKRDGKYLNATSITSELGDAQEPVENDAKAEIGE